jgi:predicted dehydrogenase
VADVLKAALMGFRHMHMFAIHAHLKEREDVEIVAVCEEDLQTRNSLAAEGKIPLSHTSFEDMLGSVDFDLLVVGDVFARRGTLIRSALSERHSLIVGAALDLKDCGAFLRTRELIRSGTIGTIHTVGFSGQHPLLRDSRPGWYFEGGNHGGTINDIAIHAVDILQWITGRGFGAVLAARSWNAGVAAHPRFHNAAQLMLVMDGGCGVIGDVSYISPDGFGYTLPQYWRLNFWGDRGMIESGFNLQKVRLYRSESDTAEEIEPQPDRSGGYLEDLLEAIRARQCSFNASLFSATEVCLKAQEAADRGVSGIPLS